MAMDKGAIEIFQEEGQILKCQKDRWDAIFYGELGSSLAILDKGFNLDSFLPRYDSEITPASKSLCSVCRIVCRIVMPVRSPPQEVL